MMAHSTLDKGYYWMNAVASGDIKQVEAVMDKRLCPMPSGRPAIISAAESGNFPLVALLISLEEDARDEYGRTALMHAAMHNHIGIVEQLHTLAGRQTYDGISALMYAAWRGHCEVVEMLSYLRNGAELGLQRSNGETALMAAVHMGNRDCVEVLVKAGGELGKQMADGTTALMLAQDREIVSLLIAEAEITRRGNITALMIAAMQNLGDIVAYLAPHLKNRTSNEGHTALMLAAQHGAVKCVELLIALTEEIKMQDNCGRTALMLAAQCGSQPCVELLIGAEGLLVDYKGRRASAYTTDDELRLRLGLFASGDIDTSGVTTLMHAARTGHEDAVTMLVAFQLGMQDNKGRTALMYACYCHSAVDVRLLHIVQQLASEATKRDVKGRFALLYLIESRVQLLQPEDEETCAAMIRALSSELFLHTPDGSLPLEYALLCERYDMGALIFVHSIELLCTPDTLEHVKQIVALLAETLYEDVSAGGCPADDRNSLIDLLLTPFTEDNVLSPLTSASHLVADMAALFQDSEFPACCICLEMEAELVLVPCGHFTYCRGCLMKLANVCPICRVPVRDTVQIKHWYETEDTAAQDNKSKDSKRLPPRCSDVSTISLRDHHMHFLLSNTSSVRNSLADISTADGSRVSHESSANNSNLDNSHGTTTTDESIGGDTDQFNLEMDLEASVSTFTVLSESLSVP